jgi:uncharacterized lipoprotein YmbA
MKSIRVLMSGLFAMLCLSGCLDLKPARNTARYFTLSVLPAEAGALDVACGYSLGLGPVKVPGYLFRSAMAMRKSPTEIEYLQDTLWADRLDASCQRVLAANLVTLLHPTNLQLSSWRSSDIRCAVHVEVEQMDIDATGRAVLSARWRVVSPDGKLLKTAESRLAKTAASPVQDPAGAAAALSGLLGDLSREIATGLRQASQSGETSRQAGL